MIVRNNISALNTWRNLKSNASRASKSSSRLSSGYRINSAADDAAGLAISEKMRAQIRGLSQASRNVQDGIALIQTAEGAMNEIQEMLIRQRELVIQSLNDTYTCNDRELIQSEISQLVDEIDSIAHRTEFNTIKVLLDAGYDIVSGGETSFGTFTPLPPFYDSSMGNWWMFPTDVPPLPANQWVDVAYYDFTNGSDGHVFSNSEFYYNMGFTFADATMPVIMAITAPNGERFTFSANTSAPYVDIHQVIPGFGGMHIQTHTGGFNSEFVFMFQFMIGIESTANPVPLPHKNPAYEGRWIFSVDNRGNVVREINFSTSVMYGSTDEGYLVAGFFDYEHHDFTDTPTISSAKKLWIQSGANNNQGMYIDLYDCRKETLEITNLSVLTRTQANQSIYDIDKAFGKVNVYRATAGAQQNRLEHTMRSLDISFENLSESESRIRNADMAKEIITHIGMILLTQAAVAMLAQANQQAELAVSLLR